MMNYPPRYKKLKTCKLRPGDILLSWNDCFMFVIAIYPNDISIGREHIDTYNFVFSYFGSTDVIQQVISCSARWDVIKSCLNLRITLERLI